MKPDTSSKPDTRSRPHGPKGPAVPKTTVIKKRFLVFNSSSIGGEPCKMVAILRIWNPTPNSDVFYKLSADCHKVSFDAKSWKGRVRKNSHIDVSIGATVANSGDATLPRLANPSKRSDAPDHEPPVLTLAQLCQTQFSLEMTEYTSRWRTNPSTCNLVVKVELQCVTRELLTKLQNEAKSGMDETFFTADHIQRFIAKYTKDICSESGREGKSHSELLTNMGPSGDEHKSKNMIEPSQPACGSSEAAAPLHCKPESDGDKKSITSTLYMLLTLLLSLVLQLLSSSMLHSKQLVHKVTGRFWPKLVKDKNVHE